MRVKNTFYGLLIFFLTVLTVSAQTGKIAGEIVDDKGEPLIGASVLIQGTSMGASTNVDGFFVILSIPPGTYTLRVSFVGYNTSILSNIKVSVNLTTQVNFTLTSQAIELGEIVKVAERPLINKNVTNATSIVRSEDIELLPLRGVNNIIATQAGVVTQGSNIHVRGSRLDAVTFYVDGVLVNNIVFGGSQTSVITNAIEEIQFQAGGYTAEFGGATGGIIATQTRTGRENYNLNIEVITDNFASPGRQYLGGYSYGYSEYVLSAGGPLFPGYKKLKFFVAANNVYNRSPIGFYKGANFEKLYDPLLLQSYQATGGKGTKPDTFDVIYPNGTLLNSGQNTYNIQGNLTWDLNPISLRLNGTFRTTEGRNGVGISGINTFNRAGMNEAYTFTSSLKFTHVVSPAAYYDLIFNYFSDYYVDMDPIFKHNITAYGDSIQNAAVGTTLRRDGLNPIALTAYGFNFTRSVIPYNLYRKHKSLSYGGKINFTYQLGSHHELKLGGEFTSYQIRRYSLPSSLSLASNIKENPEGALNRIYSRLDNYGYNVYGNESDEGIDRSKKPLFAGVYFQDKIEYSDLVINAGVRLDYIDIDGSVFKDPSNIKFTKEDLIDPTSLEKVDPRTYVSPRLGFSFPVTDRTVFHAQYGKFIQQSMLRDVYQGYNVVADNIKGGFAISSPVGFGLKPEQTIQYDIGFTQQVGDIFSFDITGFYKDIKDQIQIRTIYSVPGATHTEYYAWVNGDFATTKGIEFKFDLRRIRRIAASIDYTYSDAQGSGSNPSTGFRMIWQSPTSTPFFPQQITPLDFNQTHRGSINLDYRFADNDGPVILGNKLLENLGLNLLFTFNSGYNYTRIEGFGNARIPLEPLNTSTTPWTFQLDAKLDKTIYLFGRFNVNIYLWVINVLNTQNAIGVFGTSGDAYDNGWLTSKQGAGTIEGYRKYGEEHAQRYIDLYKALNYNAGNFGTPRQIRLGIKLNY